jgi:hypothetical protein
VYLYLTGLVACIREKRNAYRILVRNPKGKRALGRSRRRWVDNIKMGGMDWIDLALDRNQ